MRETLPLIATTTYLLDGSHHQLATVVCTVALALELAHGHQADSYLDRTLDGIEFYIDILQYVSLLTAHSAHMHSLAAAKNSPCRAEIV